MGIVLPRKDKYCTPDKQVTSPGPEGNVEHSPALVRGLRAERRLQERLWAATALCSTWAGITTASQEPLELPTPHQALLRRVH